jgi:integrase
MVRLASVPGKHCTKDSCTNICRIRSQQKPLNVSGHFMRLMATSTDDRLKNVARSATHPELLRHADIRTTMNIYTRAVPEREAQGEGCEWCTHATEVFNHSNLMSTPD